MSPMPSAAMAVARVVVIALLTVLTPAAALAVPLDDPTAMTADGLAQMHAEQQDEDEQAEADSHAHHKNVLGLFVGDTHERVDGGEITEQGFTFGVEYVRRVTPRFSLGGVLERAGGEIRGTLLIAQAYYRIAGGLYVLGGPGVEFRDAQSEEPGQHGGSGAAPETPTRERDTTVFLLRIGAVYEFEFGRWVFGPTVAIDFVGRDEALVLGASIGYAF